MPPRTAAISLSRRGEPARRRRRRADRERVDPLGRARCPRCRRWSSASERLDRARSPRRAAARRSATSLSRRAEPRGRRSRPSWRACRGAPRGIRPSPPSSSTRLSPPGAGRARRERVAICRAQLRDLRRVRAALPSCCMSPRCCSPPLSSSRRRPAISPSLPASAAAVVETVEASVVEAVGEDVDAFGEALLELRVVPRERLERPPQLPRGLLVARRDLGRAACAHRCR